MIGDKARDWYDEKAKERQIRKPADSVVETLPQQNARARDQAGKAVNVSGKTMDKAKKVREQGHKKLVEAVESGKIDGAQNAHQQKEKTAEQPPGATIRQIRPEGTDRTEIMPSGQRAAYCPTR
jgi:hypothetical protein